MYVIYSIPPKVACGIQNPQIAPTQVLDSAENKELRTKARIHPDTDEKTELKTEQRTAVKKTNPQNKPTKVISQELNKSVFTEVKSNVENQSVATSRHKIGIIDARIKLQNTKKIKKQN